MNEFIHKICMEQCQNDVFTSSLEEIHRTDRKMSTSDNDYEEVSNIGAKEKFHEKSILRCNQQTSSSSTSRIDLFAQICRLIVEMSNFPLPIIYHSMNTSRVIIIPNNPSDQLNMNLLDLFGGQLIRNPDSGQFILPQWLVCLLYASCELDNFNIKSIALYTLIELFHAAVSIHGWSTEFNYHLPNNINTTTTTTTTTSTTTINIPTANSDSIDSNIQQIHSVINNDSNNTIDVSLDSKHQTHHGMRLVFPVLSGELMAYLCQKTNLFMYLGVSLWRYLSPEHSIYHEDTASLLVRLHHLAPPLPKSVSSVCRITQGSSRFSSTVSSCIESFILSQMLTYNLDIKIDAHSRFILLWHLMRSYGLRIQSNTNPSIASSTNNSVSAHQFPTVKRPGHSSLQDSFRLNGVFNSISAVSWRRRFLGLVGAKQIGNDESSPGLGLCEIPFYRQVLCTLLLLDSLDYDDPFNPTGFLGSMNLYQSQFNTNLISMDKEQVNKTNDQKEVNSEDYDEIDHPSSFGDTILKEQSIVWLEKALRTGQIDRLLAPILAILLHPATARISLKSHVLRHYCQEVKLLKSGELLTNDPSKSNYTLDTDCKPPSYEEVVNEIKTTTLQSEPSNISTIQTEKPINLISSIRARFQRFHASTELLDGTGITNQMHASKQQAAEAVLNSVLCMRLMQAEENCSLLDYVTDWHQDSTSLSMLPINEHLLVIYAFSRLRAILSITPSLFVRSLASCTINSLLCLNLYDLKFGEILAKHRRSLFGGNFFTSASSDELNQSQQTYSNLLELIIDLCLQFMCSYLPFITTSSAKPAVDSDDNASGINNLPTINNTSTSHMSSTAESSIEFGHRFGYSKQEFRANQFVQNTAADILRLIVEQLMYIQDDCFNSSSINSLLKSNSSISTVKHSLSYTRISESQSSSSLNPNIAPLNAVTFSSMIQQANGRRLVHNTLYHTCLPSVVLHCLATCIIKVYWPKNCSVSSTPNGIRKLPNCLQLVLVNDILSNLPNSFHTTQIQTLLKLFNAVLHLKPWYGYSDRMSLVKYHQLAQQNCQTPTDPAFQHNNNLLWPVCSSLLMDNDVISADLLTQYMTDVWLKAYNQLPDILHHEALFRTNCLTTLYRSNMKSSNVTIERDQFNLFVELLSIGLSSPSLSDNSMIHQLHNGSFFIARLDLHPLWYHFIFNSISYWGWFIASLVHIIIKQVCSSLNKLCDRALQDMQTYTTSMKRSQPSDTNEWDLLPTDYTLTALALIQSVCHAFLLPLGNASLPLISSRKACSFQPTNNNGTLRGNTPSVSHLTGLPDSIEGAVEIAEILCHHKLNPPNPTGSTSEVSSNTVPAFDPLFPSPLTENADCSNVVNFVSKNQSLDNISTSEPSIILSSGNGDDKLETKEMPVHSPSATVIFLNRVKNSQNVNIKDDLLNPEHHPFVQAHLEVLRLMPDIFSSISVLWNALNQSPLSQLTKVNFYKSTCAMTSRYPDKEHWPSLMLSIPPERLPSLTNLGSANLVRGAIRRLLKPIASQHPDLVLITTAVAWPNTTFDSETGGLLAGVDSLVNYGPLDMLMPVRMKNNDGISGVYCIPLHQKQVSLLDLISGRTYDERFYGPVLPATLLINQLRDCMRRPMNNAILVPVIGTIQYPCNSTLLSPVGSLSTSQEMNSTCKMPSNSNSGVNFLRLQMNLLHLFYAWLIMKPDFVSSDLLLVLLRDLINMPTIVNYNSANIINITSNSVLGLPPAAIFILMKIFSKFLETVNSTDDRREQRELQELCHRLLEATAAIAASALHQPSWFRKTLQVRQLDGDLTNPSPSLQPVNSVDLADRLSLSGSEISEPIIKSDQIESESCDLIDSHIFTQVNNTNNVVFNDAEHSSVKEPYDKSLTSAYYSKSRHSSLNLLTNEITRIRMRSDVTIQAIELLTENMAIFLDLVYRSDEKDRVSTFLNNILCNIFPYLRVRMLSNSDHFTVASKLIASVSSYQYTRKSWRRDVLDLFYEPVFFQMSPVALQSWNSIIDNLMTQDKTTFKEALTRLVFAQPGGLNLFTSKESEYCLRAACLKKLSYLVFASEPDQYAKSMPDLLERLTECLRLGQGLIPVVHTQVFLFARVLISRMSAIQLTSLWPIVVPELFLTFKSLSQAIQECISKIQSKKRNPNISMTSFLSGAQMNLYLSACKFLATSLLCPESKVPQFSYYQWAFINDITLEGLIDDEDITNFAKLNSCKVTSFQPYLTEVLEQIEKLQEIDISNGIDVTPSETTFTLHQGCFNLLALDKLVNIFTLKPFLESLNRCSNLDSSQGAFNDPPEVDRFLLELSLEASLAQEFPETIASR
ncbi:Protein dopey-1 [Schistosoma japonicum]|nr:Protein dopey-1 [Schistosoma japonicum]